MIEIDDTLLIEFLGGKLDATTSAEVERWYDASDENRRRLERLYLVFFTGERLSAAAAVDPNLSWQTLRRRIEAHRRPAPTKRLRTVVRYAAVFAVGLLTAGSLLFPYRSADDRTCTVTTEERACSIRRFERTTDAPLAAALRIRFRQRGPHGTSDGGSFLRHPQNGRRTVYR